MDLITTSNPARPELDMELTESLLSAVARGERPELTRVFRPGPTVAFGRVDRTNPGYDAARRAAQAHARTPVVRLGGGHAAAYDQGSVIIEIIRRKERIVGGLDERFIELVELIQGALSELGVSSEVGELPGEYCPGRYSLHLPSGPKLAGLAQRIVSGASLATAVLVVEGGDALRSTLADVYRALGLPIDIATAGAVTDHHPGVTVTQVQQALLDLLRERSRTA